MKMQIEFEKFLLEKQLCKKGQKILLAVSGGVDSIVMTNLFLESGYDVAVAHMNFSLRGKESDADQILVESLGASHGLTCHVSVVDTKNIARERKISTQMAARDLRYEWFNNLIQELSYDCIATAHHFDDVIETLFFNLTKGTGIAGLHGIQAKQGKLIRPMLFANKEVILAYAKENSLVWREDKSNTSNAYARNLIRNQVIPLLREINPNLEQTMKQTLEKLTGVEAIFREKIVKAEKAFFSKQGRDVLVSKQLIKEDATVTIHELLKSFGFNYSQVKQLQRSINQTGKIFLSSSHQLNIDRDKLIISEIKEGSGEHLLAKDNDFLGLADFDLSWHTIPANGLEFDDSNMKAVLDLEHLSFPLVVRPWRPGDRFRPLGMANSKKVSDFLIDNKVAVNLKQRVCVLLSGGMVAWVIGYRIDDRFKVTDQTKTALTVSCIPH